MADRLADLRGDLELRNYGDWILVDLAYGSGAMEIGVVEGLVPEVWRLISGRGTKEASIGKFQKKI